MVYCNQKVKILPVEGKLTLIKVPQANFEGWSGNGANGQLGIVTAPAQPNKSDAVVFTAPPPGMDDILAQCA